MRWINVIFTARYIARGEYYSIITWCFSYWHSYRSSVCSIGLWMCLRPMQQASDLFLCQYEKHQVRIPLLISQSKIFLAIVETSSGFRYSCYWTDRNWANKENIQIQVFAILPQWKFLYCMDRFDHIKANKSKLIKKMFYQRTLLGTSANQKRHYQKSYNNIYYWL